MSGLLFSINQAFLCAPLLACVVSEKCESGVSEASVESLKKNSQPAFSEYAHLIFRTTVNPD